MKQAIILNQYRSGSDYKDKIGELYHFPQRYLKLISQTPSQFIYYEPRTGGTKSYFGTGIIRSTYEDTEEAGHYYAELSDYRPFSEDISYYEGPQGQPWEDSKTMRNSARTISAKTFNKIIAAGGLIITAPTEAWEDSVSKARQELKSHQKKDLKANPRRLRKVKRIIESFERPSHVTNYVKQTRGDTCQLCLQPGFLMNNGRKYCEVHHLFHLSDNPPPDCLEPFYLIVLCATCHRRMHYAKTSEPKQNRAGWSVDIDGIPYHFITASF